MKKLYILSLLIAAFGLLFSCKPQDNPEPDDKTPSEVPAETRTLTFVLPAIDVEEGEEAPAALKQQWVAGDQIVVHGEYAKDQVTVTLAAGDISADGKSATLSVSGLRPYKRDDCASTLYASYPASAVDNLKHCFFYSAFKNENTQLLSACNSGDTFRFQNISAAVSFVVDGDFDSYAFTARKDVTINFDLFQVKITDAETNLRQYVQNPSTTIEINGLVADGKTENSLFIPGGADLAGGFILRFFKDGKAVKAITDKEAFTLPVGKVLDLGDITDLLVDAADDIDPSLATPLDNYGHANCYIVYQSGLYRFSAVRGNTDTPLSGVVDADILWETRCDGDEIAERSVIAGVIYDEETGSVCFQLPNPAVPGNALIAVRDKDETILWSWHIWIPETPVTEDTYGFGSYKLMSRNLGALVDTQAGAPADSRSFGLHYQWGRKDPFLGARAIDSAEKVTFAGVGMTVAEGVIEAEESVDKPTVFISVNGAWCNGNDNMMWGDVERDAAAAKSVYDPCPTGYRIPGRKHFSIFDGNGSGLAGWNYDAVNGVLLVGSPAASFPIGGYLSYDGTVVNGSSIVWDARNDYESGKVSYSMYISGNESAKSGRTRAFGGSVRCEAE